MRSGIRVLSLSVSLTALLAMGCPNTQPNKTTEPKPEPPGPLATGPARAEIKRTSQDAGEVELSIPTEWKFPVRNGGGQPLTLTLLRRNCFCTDAVMPADAIPVGVEGVVIVRWTPIPGKSGPHRIHADVATNDPNRPVVEFEVTGVVNPLIRIAPEDISFIDFYRLEPGAVKPRELKVFSTKLAKFDLEAKTDLPGLKVTTSQLALDFTSRIGAARPTCAYSVLIETTPQLPPGFFMTDLVLTLKAPDAPSRDVRMRVYGEVANGLFKVLPDEVEFTARRLADGDQRKVRVQFIDPSRKQMLKIAKVEPNFVQCREPHALPGAPGQWEFTARIPPENAAAAKVQADGFFEGLIVLETSGSDAKIPVRVKWNPPEVAEKP
jgi:hypothetical protein